MMEMQLFRMCFPEEFVKEVLIPAMNEQMVNRLTLGEFYEWLGCNFFKAEFPGDPGPSVLVVE